MMIQKMFRITKRDKMLLLILFIILYSFFTWYFSGRPVISDFDQPSSKLAGLKHEYHYLLNILDQRETIEKAWLREVDSSEQQTSGLLDLTAMPEVLNSLEIFLEERPVTVKSLRISEAVHFENHASAALYLNVSGSHHHLQDLVNQLELLPHFILFDYLKWEFFPGQNAELELQMQLLFYIDRL